MSVVHNFGEVRRSGLCLGQELVSMLHILMEGFGEVSRFGGRAGQGHLKVIEVLDYA